LNGDDNLGNGGSGAPSRYKNGGQSNGKDSNNNDVAGTTQYQDITLNNTTFKRTLGSNLLTEGSSTQFL
jgi:hypothetical protein